jgi:hypothetical protein
MGTSDSQRYSKGFSEADSVERTGSNDSEIDVDAINNANSSRSRRRSTVSWEDGGLFAKPSRSYDDSTVNASDSPSESIAALEEGDHEEQKRRAPPNLMRQGGVRHVTGQQHYNWRKFFRARTFADIFHWLAYGFSPDLKKSHEDMLQDLAKLARLLKMLRDYDQRYGLPEEGGPRDQEYVLREVTKELYATGCPVWALEGVMSRCSEGITGNEGVDFFILPRKVRTLPTLVHAEACFFKAICFDSLTFEHRALFFYDVTGFHLCPFFGNHSHVPYQAWVSDETSQ